MTGEEKEKRLRERMKEYAKEDVIVAFSGGADSSLLLKLAVDAAKDSGKRVVAVMMHTMLHPVREAEEAERTAAEIGAEFRVLRVDELEGAEILDNPQDRCYRCKKYLFCQLMREGERLGISQIIEGTNEDDLHVYRPGIRAVRELGIMSPLADAGLTKEEVRKLAGELGLSVSEKPAAPCLATRFPYGTRLTYEAMRRVEQGESFLRERGFYNVRLRIYGTLARIEVDPAEFERLIEQREEITAFLKKLGYDYITLDLEGFRSGSMDIQLQSNEK